MSRCLSGQWARAPASLSLLQSIFFLAEAKLAHIPTSRARVHIHTAAAEEVRSHSFSNLLKESKEISLWHSCLLAIFSIFLSP
jgi:hypothetical protein